jgi:hypothetical protein
MDLSFLPKQERKTVALIAAGCALLWGGWKAHDLIGDAQAAEARVSRLEHRMERTDRNVARIDRNVIRLMRSERISPEEEDPGVETQEQAR